MNRQGAGPQSLRGMPAGFGGQQPQQQAQQPGRAVSNRLPNGKMAGGSSGWAFGSGIQMGSGGLQNPPRQLGGAVSFAQSLGGSQPATPLDLSEFPSLSGNPQLSSTSQSPMWAMGGGTRNLSGPAGIQRNQPTPLSSQQQQAQQDDIYAPSSRLPANQGSFRFGNQAAAIGQQSQAQPGGVDENFPPLNRNANGEIGRERGGPSLMSSLGFGSQAVPSSNGPSSAQSRAGNGLLNALSANTRAAEARSPIGTRPLETRSMVPDDDSRQRSASLRGAVTSQSSPLEDPPLQGDSRHQPGAIGNSGALAKAKEDPEEQSPPVSDPMAGVFPEIDKWGLKGLRFMMSNFPDYSALVSGIDYTSMNLNLQSNEPISDQLYSPFDDAPPRPAVPKFRLPECYKVTNVQEVDAKVQGFNEETLMWMFYSSPNDAKQQLAAVALNNRNWRWHKKLQVWLTKDEHMMPQVISPTHERGYYLIWDTTTWTKERRELALHYADLDTNPMGLNTAG